MADAASNPAAITPAATVQPKTVALIIDDNERRAMRNTFVFWELVTLGIGVYVGKKIFEPGPAITTKGKR